jgi:hypothetical protein
VDELRSTLKKSLDKRKHPAILSYVATPAAPYKKEDHKMANTTMNQCLKCGKGIKPTGRKGRPRKTHRKCAEILARQAVRAKAQARKDRATKVAA